MKLPPLDRAPRRKTGTGLPGRSKPSSPLSARVRRGRLAKFVLGFGVLLLPSCKGTPPKPIVREFQAEGISQVILRASMAQSATVTQVAMETPVITVTGTPTGGAEGYHPADPSWRETPTSRWGLDFVSQRFGPTLVISTKNEIGYIHHEYMLARLTVQLPNGVRLVRETRELTGDAAPDLSAP